jgi:integrase
MKGCRALTPAEVTHLTQALQEGTYALRNQALFTLGVKTGLRISELLQLRVMDVYRGGQVVMWLRVRHVKRRTAGRRLPLHQQAQQALEAWLRSWREQPPAPEAWLFPSRQGSGKPLGGVQAWQIFDLARRRCGIPEPIGTHCLRKTFAQYVYKATGHDLIRTQYALGHAYVTSTQCYLEGADETLFQVILAS